MSEKKGMFNFMRDKYLEDYERKLVLDPRTGKMRNKYVYAGPVFELTNPEYLNRSKLIFLITALVSTAAWVASLSINGDLAHSWVIIPNGIFVVVLYLQLCATVRVLFITPRKELHLEDMDKTAPRLKILGIAGTILGVAGVICHIIYGITIGQIFGDLWNYGVNIVMAVSSFFVCKFSGLVDMEKKEN